MPLVIIIPFTQTSQETRSRKRKTHGHRSHTACLLACSRRLASCRVERALPLLLPHCAARPSLFLPTAAMASMEFGPLPPRPAPLTSPTPAIQATPELLSSDAARLCLFLTPAAVSSSLAGAPPRAATAKPHRSPPLLKPLIVGVLPSFLSERASCTVDVLPSRNVAIHRGPPPKPSPAVCHAAPGVP
jgi:hypothetical protein